VGAPPLTRTMSIPACNLNGSHRERYPFPLFVLEQCSCFEGKGQTKPLRGKKKTTYKPDESVCTVPGQLSYSQRNQAVGARERMWSSLPIHVIYNQISIPMPKRYTHLLMMTRFVCVNRCINLITHPHDSCTGIRCSCEK